MKGWLWVFAILTVMTVSAGVFFGTDEQKVSLLPPDHHREPLLIIDSKALQMVTRFNNRETDTDVLRLRNEFINLSVLPEMASVQDMKNIDLIAVSYADFEKHPELVGVMKTWMRQGKRVYFYGDEIKSAELEKELGIVLERKSSEKKAVKGEEGSYQIIGYQEKGLPTAFFGTILVASEQKSNRPYESPSVAPDVFLQTILQVELHQLRRGIPRNDRLELANHSQLRVKEDWSSSLYLLREEDGLLLLADLTTGVDLYQRLNESIADSDLFFLTHGTEVVTYHGARSKYLRVHHEPAFEEDNIDGHAPFSQTGREVETMIDQNLKWRYRNDEAVVLEETSSMADDTVTWTVKPRAWRFALGERTLVVPGTYWNSSGTYTGLSIAEQVTIGYEFREFNLSSKRTIHYEYEKGYVMP